MLCSCRVAAVARLAGPGLERQDDGTSIVAAPGASAMAFHLTGLRERRHRSRPSVGGPAERPVAAGLLAEGRAVGTAAWDRAALLLLAAGLVLVLLTFRHYGVTWDEPGLRTYGRMLVDWYASGFNDGQAFTFANLRYYGGAFDITATLLEPLTPLGPYELRHLMGGLIGLLGLGLAWRLARRIGGPRAGFLALLLLATLPGWWGHMFFNSKDVPFAVGMLASVYAWTRCLEEWPRPRLRTALLLGLAVGLTMGIRIGGVLLGAYFAVPFLLLTGLEARRLGIAPAARRLGGGVARLLPAVPVTFLVLLPAWPWVMLAPGNFLEAVAYLGHFPYGADTIFAGQRYPADAVPASYWPTLLALQLTEVALLGLLAAALLLPQEAGRPESRHGLLLLTVAIAGLFPLAYAMLARPTAYNNIRHFIFVLPPLLVLAGLGLDRLLARLHGYAAWLVAGAIALGFLLPAVRIFQLHPYEYVYFNDLSGGLRAAEGRFELDYWGTSFGELGRRLEPELAAHADRLGLLPIPARICGPFETAQEVLPPSLIPVHHSLPGHLAIASAMFFCIDPPRERELARVERLGVVLSRAFLVDDATVFTRFKNP
jgi:hypothetical protein